MFVTVKIGDKEELLGEIAAITVSVREGFGGVGCKSVAGTIVFSKLNYPVFKQYMPEGIAPCRWTSLKVEIPEREQSPGATVVFDHFKFVNLGWGWSVDDLTSEVAVTYEAGAAHFGGKSFEAWLSEDK